MQRIAFCTAQVTADNHLLQIEDGFTEQCQSRKAMAVLTPLSFLSVAVARDMYDAEQLAVQSASVNIQHLQGKALRAHLQTPRTAVES